MTARPGDVLIPRVVERLAEMRRARERAQQARQPGLTDETSTPRGVSIASGRAAAKRDSAKGGESTGLKATLRGARKTRTPVTTAGGTRAAPARAGGR